MSQSLPDNSDALRLAAFARLVRTARDLQKRWFAGERTDELLRFSKDAERKVDAAVAAILAPPPPPTLFGPDPRD